jgi:hypothetical protein
MNPEYACQHPEGLIAEPSREPACIRIETANSLKSRPAPSRSVLFGAFSPERLQRIKQKRKPVPAEKLRRGDSVLFASWPEPARF